MVHKSDFASHFLCIGKDHSHYVIVFCGFQYSTICAPCSAQASCKNRTDVLFNFKLLGLFVVNLCQLVTKSTQ